MDRKDCVQILRLTVLLELNTSLDVAQMSVDQVARPGLITPIDRIDDSAMVMFLAERCIGRSIETDDQRTTQHQFPEETGKHYVAAGLAQNQVELARQPDRVAAVSRTASGAVASDVIPEPCDVTGRGVSIRLSGLKICWKRLRNALRNCAYAILQRL